MTLRNGPFEGEAPESSRYVWDQSVHHWHGDRCVVFLIALPAVSEDSRTEVEALLKKVGVVSHSSYLAYGPYDIVLRIWCTLYERENVIREINEAYSFPEMEVFDVVDIDYSRWSSCSVLANEECVVEHLDSIRALVDEPDNDQLADKLSEQGLVHLHSLPPSEGDVRTRIYILLRRTLAESGMNAGRLDAIQRALGTLNFLQMPSVYYGSGRTVDCVIKGFINSNSIPTFHRSVLKLRHQLLERQIDLRPMTLILAQDGEIDRDVLRIDPPLGLDPPDVRRLKSVLGAEAVEAWGKLDPALRQSVASDFARVWPRVSDSTFARALKDLIEGVVLADEYRVNGSLAFLIQTEAMFKSACVRRVFPALLGPTWQVTARDRLQSIRELANEEPQATDVAGRVSAIETTLERLAKPQKLGFGEMLKVTEVLVDEGIIDKNEAEEVLGVPLRVLHASVDVRNSYAHGNLMFSSDDSAVAWWTAHAGRVLAAGSVSAELERMDRQ